MGIRFSYHCILNKRPYTANPVLIDEFFTLIGFITGIARPTAELMLHNGYPIEHERVTFYAVPLKRGNSTENRETPAWVQ